MVLHILCVRFFCAERRKTEHREYEVPLCRRQRTADRVTCVIETLYVPKVGLEHRLVARKRLGFGERLFGGQAATGIPGFAQRFFGELGVCS